MRMLLSLPASRYRLIAIAAALILPALAFAAWPHAAHAAGVSDENTIHTQHLRLSHLGRAGDVDVRRFHHA